MNKNIFSYLCDREPKEFDLFFKSQVIFFKLSVIDFFLLNARLQGIIDTWNGNFDEVKNNISYANDFICKQIPI